MGMKTELSPETRKKALAELKKKTKCDECGQTGHWGGDLECKKKVQYRKTGFMVSYNACSHNCSHEPVTNAVNHYERMSSRPRRAEMMLVPALQDAPEELEVPVLQDAPSSGSDVSESIKPKESDEEPEISKLYQGSWITLDISQDREGSLPSDARESAFMNQSAKRVSR